MTVIHRQAARRSGITLTEILISIMIMGIGFVSVATLFPIALMRMRDATRASRSTLLAETAANEVNARDLLNGPSFVDPATGWYTEHNLITGNRVNGAGVLTVDPAWPFFRNRYVPSPWTKDLNGGAPNDRRLPGVYANTLQAGLPVAYDPVFWSAVHYNTYDAATPAAALTPISGTTNRRFGSGMGFIRTDNGPPPTHGLQRITNFIPYNPADTVRSFYPLTYPLPTIAPALASQVDVAGDVFSSIDDPIFAETDSNETESSPLVPADFNPDPAIYEPQRVWDFTWMVTARQASAGDSSVYEADIVIFHKRPIGFETVRAPYAAGGQAIVPSGERTVEAVWGHTSSSTAIPGGYSVADDRTVLLRWHVGTPDPLVRVGDYIADVTYERIQSRSVASFPGLYQGQRCHWYRIVQVGQMEPDPAIANHRRVVLRVDTPLKAKTRLTVNGGQVVPVVPEAALLCPYVVNVYSTLLYSRQ